MDKLLFESSSQKRNVGKIIDKILERRYPEEVTEITFKELLNWNMWQTFIKIHSKYCSNSFNCAHLIVYFYR